MHQGMDANQDLDLTRVSGDHFSRSTLYYPGKKKVEKIGPAWPVNKCIGEYIGHVSRFITTDRSYGYTGTCARRSFIIVE